MRAIVHEIYLDEVSVDTFGGEWRRVREQVFRQPGLLCRLYALTAVDGTAAGDEILAR